MPITIPIIAKDGAKSTVQVKDPPVSAVTIQIGETTVLSGTDNGNGNLLIGQAVTLAQAATIQSLSFYVRTTSGGLRLGLYDATGTGGNPGKLLAATAAFTPVAGWNTAGVVTPVLLQPGNYWLAYLPQNNALAFPVLQGGGPIAFKSFTYAAMPATFPTSPTTGSAHWSFYATLTTSPPPLPPVDTTPPTVPTNVHATPE